MVDLDEEPLAADPTAEETYDLDEEEEEEEPNEFLS